MEFTGLRHVPRRIRFLELWEETGWRMKIYGISELADRPQPILLEVAKALARGQLPQPALTSKRYGVGFIGVHEAKAYNQIFVDYWEDVTELRHFFFREGTEGESRFADITSTGAAVSIWDIRIQAFERDLWVSKILMNGSAPDFDAYLAGHLEE